LRRARFGISKAAHPVEWLSDNGSAYIAKDTLDTATALGRKLCFTPIRSPESNGIAEAFVNTFKRDYARLSILPDAETVIALLTAWFEDYNEVHPHSGLKFLSPREFLRLSAYRNQLPVRSNGVHTSEIIDLPAFLPPRNTSKYRQRKAITVEGWQRW
jgi:transposase InsO family protein